MSCAGRRGSRFHRPPAQAAKGRRSGRRGRWLCRDALPVDMHDRVEGEGRAHRRGAKAGDDAVQPARTSSSRPDLTPHEEEDPYIGEGIEAEIEGVGQRRRWGTGAPEGLDRQGYVARGPREQSEPEEECGSAICPAGETPGYTQRTGYELDATDRPAVEPGVGVPVAPDDQRYQVSQKRRARTANAPRWPLWICRYDERTHVHVSSAAPQDVGSSRNGRQAGPCTSSKFRVKFWELCFWPPSRATQDLSGFRNRRKNRISQAIRFKQDDQD